MGGRVITVKLTGGGHTKGITRGRVQCGSRHYSKKISVPNLVCDIRDKRKIGAQTSATEGCGGKDGTMCKTFLQFVNRPEECNGEKIGEEREGKKKKARPSTLDTRHDKARNTSSYSKQERKNCARPDTQKRGYKDKEDAN